MIFVAILNLSEVGLEVFHDLCCNPKSFRSRLACYFFVANFPF
jgi:hypothetical protein